MIRTDSRKVKPGDTFIALKGISSNGDEYIESAIANGAAKIVCTEGTYSVETINVPDTRKYLEQALEEEYGDVISRMTLIGLTGTNGKTSTCYFISEALNALGRKCAYIGTIGFYMGEKVCSLPNTSVDLCHLYELLLTAHENGYDTVALEASSQGLDMGRFNTISFDVAAFTNLTEDHLDYHKTFEAYALCKQMLFKKLKDGGTTILNTDDPYYSYFLPGENGLKSGRLITFGTGECDFRILDVDVQDVTTLKFSAYGREYTVETDMIGMHNMYNLVTCIACLYAIGISMDEILNVIPQVHLPAGRMERYRYGSNTVFVDFAHTPDAFEKIYEAVAPLKNGRIYTIFGCTGSREREKRPVMTRLALENSDYVIISSDDLHFENPDSITADMLEGNEKFINYEVNYDRPTAIRKAMSMMKDKDILFLLGLGHQDSIDINGKAVHHSDREVVLQVISEGK